MYADPGLFQVREFLSLCQALLQLPKLSFVKLSEDRLNGVEIGDSLADKLILVPKVRTIG